MSTQDHSTLISTAPPEVLLLLVTFFIITVLVLLALAVEAGHYRDVVDWLRRLPRNNPWARRQRRRWLLLPGGGYPLATRKNQGGANC